MSLFSRLRRVNYAKVACNHRLFCTQTQANIKLSLTGTPEYSAIGYNDNKDKLLFMASLSAPHFDIEHRAPIDLVCVLDESGSMQGDAIKTLKESMEFIVSNLSSIDRFGCIGYTTTARVISQMNYMNSDMKQNALQQIKSMKALSTTALCDGLEMGVNMMRETQKNKQNEIDSNNSNRVQNILLLTDGLPNVGYSDPKDIMRAMTDKEFADKGRHTEDRPDNPNIPNRSTWRELTPKTEYGALPCSIDAFGFGEHHSEDLLTMISEYGKGSYAFIEEEKDIRGTFGELLGGLISVIGKDIKIRIKSLKDNVEILKCFAAESDSDSNLELKEIEKFKKYEITVLNEIQSEEFKHLLFELSIPKTDTISMDWNYIEIECEYFNVITNQMEKISTVCTITRPNESTQERNHEIDIQHNKIMATEAVYKATKEADVGNFKKAKEMIKNVQNEINNSVSANDENCKLLVEDLQRCLDGMESLQEYRSHGKKYNHGYYKGHTTHSFSSGSDDYYPSQQVYSTSYKKFYRKEAEKDKHDKE